MKSGRYEILPRVRKIQEGLYKCTWRDPGKTIQHRGKPLQYINVFIGLGISPDAAIRDCQRRYLKYLDERDNSRHRSASALNGPDISLGPSDTLYTATSNLPWWKRLFRV